MYRASAKSDGCRPNRQALPVGVRAGGTRHPRLAVLRYAIEHLEATVLESLVEHPEAGSIPGQRLHPVAALAEEDEQVAGLRVFVDGAYQFAAQTVESLRMSTGLRPTKILTEDEGGKLSILRARPSGGARLARRNCPGSRVADRQIAPVRPQNSYGHVVHGRGTTSIKESSGMLDVVMALFLAVRSTLWTPSDFALAPCAPRHVRLSPARSVATRVLCASRVRWYAR
ncbi:MAG: hypothetical protein ACI8QZ_003868 [Chlamydiales bacterium]|jgi:hypothetical protein